MRLAIHYLESIEGVEIYPIIGLIIFFTMFVIMLVHTLRLDKASVETYKNIPLDEEDHLNNE
jgi:hypothetical protein